MGGRAGAPSLTRWPPYPPVSRWEQVRRRRVAPDAPRTAVSPDPPAPSPELPPAQRPTPRRIAGIAESATLAVDAKAKALQAAGKPVIGFGAGEPDFPTP